MAAFAGDATATRALLESGANASIRTPSGTALEQARRGQEPSHREVVRLLEEHLKQYPNGMRPELNPPEQKNPPLLANFNRTTPLLTNEKFETYYERRYSGRPITEVMADLDRILDIKNFFDKDHEHLVCFAISKTHINLLTYLLDRCGSNLIIHSSLKYTPLTYCAKYGNAECFDIIFARKDINLLAKDHSGWNTLHHLVNRNKIRQAKMLMERLTPSDLLLRTGKGILSGLETVLHLAAMGGYGPLAINLCEKAGNSLLTIVDQKGQIPIHEAIKKHDLNMVKILLIMGTDPDFKLNGKTCYQFAQEKFIAIKEDASEADKKLNARAVLTELHAFRDSPVEYRRQPFPFGGDYSEHTVLTAKCSLM
ncbi:MAG TPA: ankyrin repeat domain-containing protein [Gammaproteobacteria bacterium]|nr:ankyrin repeat domain-containing protein [Gammaproteobacteria bacterium]